MTEGILIGFFLALLNTIVSLIVIGRAYKKEGKKFNKLIFGSFVIRFFVVVMVIGLIFSLTNVDKISFSLSFIGATLVFIFIEILYLHKRGKKIKINI